MASESVNPFDYVNAINKGEDIITFADDPLDAEAAYIPHLTNRAFSYHIDAVLHANEMNLRFDLDSKLQYLYYLYTLRPKRRYGMKWVKPTPQKNVKALQAVFACNDERAKTVLSLLSNDQIKQIQSMVSMMSDNNNEPTNKIGRSGSSS